MAAQAPIGETSAAPERATPVCCLADLADGGGMPVALSVDGRKLTLLVFRDGERVVAYVDCCPHMGTSLLWGRKLLVAANGRQVRCANHDARFRVRDGLCIVGPCIGERLEAAPISVADGQVWLHRSGLGQSDR